MRKYNRIGRSGSMWCITISTSSFSLSIFLPFHLSPNFSPIIITATKINLTLNNLFSIIIFTININANNQILLLNNMTPQSFFIWFHIVVLSIAFLCLIGGVIEAIISIHKSNKK